MDRYARLGEQCGGSEQQRDRMLGYLYVFAVHYNRVEPTLSSVSHPGDIRGMSGCRDDLQRGREAWNRMRMRWTPKYAASVRTWLSEILRHHVPALMLAVNPTARRRRRTTHCYVTSSSHEHRFELHSCLPLCVRTLASHHKDYVLMTRLLTTEEKRYSFPRRRRPLHSTFAACHARTC